MIEKLWYDANNTKLKGIVKELKATDHHLTLRANNTGSWMNVRVNTVTGKVLAGT